LGGHYSTNYSDAFAAAASLPVHHFYLSEPTSHGPRGAAGAASASGAVSGPTSLEAHQSVRPRKCTPRSAPGSRVASRRGTPSGIPSGIPSGTPSGIPSGMPSGGPAPAGRGLEAPPAPFATVYQPGSLRRPDSPGRQARAAADLWRSKEPARSSEPPKQRHVAQTVV
jgi:hypothetical protein